MPVFTMKRKCAEVFTMIASRQWEYNKTLLFSFSLRVFVFFKIIFGEKQLKYPSTDEWINKMRYK